MSVIFVRTRHNYVSMQDYYRLAELAGYPIVYDDEMQLDNPAHCYILSWFSTQSPFPDDVKARLICWNLEWADVPILPGVEYWSPDKAYAEQHDWRYVPVGSDARLFDGVRYASGGVDIHIPGMDFKIYDVTLQMYRDVLRRASLIKRIRDGGITIAPDGWNEQRHHALLHSRVQVHIHQHDNQHVVSPLRFAVAAAYRLPIITERLHSAGAFDGLVIQSSYDGLPECLNEYLSPARRIALHEYGAALHEKLCHELTFQKVVESSV